MIDFEGYGAVDLTTAELNAIRRVGEDKDFAVLMDVLLREHIKRAYDLLWTPHEDQNIMLIRNQGGLAQLKHIKALIDGPKD